MTVESKICLWFSNNSYETVPKSSFNVTGICGQIDDHFKLTFKVILSCPNYNERDSLRTLCNENNHGNISFLHFIYFIMFH